MPATVRLPVPEWLPARTRELIQRTVVIAQDLLRDRLSAAVLVGAAMNPARQDRHQHPEILAIVSEPGELGPLAEALSPVMSQGIRLRLLTERELRQSCDVFALEIADWKARHRLLFGEDPLTALRPTPAHLRHGIETELRGLSRRIRNRVLSGLATHGGRDDPAQAISDGIDRFTVAGYHTLRLLGEDPPHGEVDLITRVCSRAGADAAPLLAQLAEVRAGRQPPPLVALAALLGAVAPLTEMIDALAATDDEGAT